MCCAYTKKLLSLFKYNLLQREGEIRDLAKQNFLKTSGEIFKRKKIEPAVWQRTSVELFEYAWVWGSALFPSTYGGPGRACSAKQREELKTNPASFIPIICKSLCASLRGQNYYTSLEGFHEYYR